jgi:hypothetical protein
MQYRNFGKLDWKPSALGFGCMRLPVADGLRGSANIDQPEAIRMIRHAIDNGLNYLDTAYPYHSGNSERLLGHALLDGYRDRVRIATKLPTWMVKSPDDFDRLLNEQLEKLQTGQIDFYLFHALSRAWWRNGILAHNILDRAERALADGRIRNLGFSFHDEYSAFEEILNGTDLFTFCQIQLNYMDTEHQAGLRGLRAAADKGLAVVVMEPLMGGRLADPPPAVAQILAGRNPVQLAFDWVWSLPEVSVVLSGMNNFAQIEENLRLADASRPGKLGPADHALIDRIRKEYRARVQIPCSKCGYCMPCPNGVDIPANFEMYNYAYTYDDPGTARFRYKFMADQGKASARAASCIDCGICEDLCPQAIPIPEWMKKVHAELG